MPDQLQQAVIRHSHLFVPDLLEQGQQIRSQRGKAILSSHGCHCSALQVAVGCVRVLCHLRSCVCVLFESVNVRVCSLCMRAKGVLYMYMQVSAHNCKEHRRSKSPTQEGHSYLRGRE